MAFEPKPAGTILSGRYRVLRLIGAGGMGAAYEAEDREHPGKRVVVKLLANRAASDEERQTAIRNFLAEVQVLSALSHPNIPRMLDHFLEGTDFCFVMELVDGISLGDLLTERGRTGLPVGEVIQWGVEVCRVLEYIHSRTPPVIHRDLKPSNLIRRHSDGRLFVIDFGIARVARPEEGKMIGTLGYAAPEQHENRVDPRSDLYALGVTIHELLTGMKPEPYRFEFPFPHEVRPEVSVDLSGIVIRALYFDPAERWESAATFREALESLPEHGARRTVGTTDGRYFFALAAREYWETHLLPLLERARTRYAHVCQTSGFPRECDRLELVLGLLTPWKLVAILDEEAERVIFSEQEGVLPPKPLGSVNPGRREEWGGTEIILETFLDHFEGGHFEGIGYLGGFPQQG